MLCGQRIFFGGVAAVTRVWSWCDSRANAVGQSCCVSLLRCSISTARFSCSTVWISAKVLLKSIEYFWAQKVLPIPVSIPSGKGMDHTSIPIQYKTAELSQRRPRDAPNIWVPWKVLRVLTTHPATFPEICNGLLLRSILRMCVQSWSSHGPSEYICQIWRS